MRLGYNRMTAIKNLVISFIFKITRNSRDGRMDGMFRDVIREKIVKKNSITHAAT